jgi:hypothetical protein
MSGAGELGLLQAASSKANATNPRFMPHPPDRHRTSTGRVRGYICPEQAFFGLMVLNA